MCIKRCDRKITRTLDIWRSKYTGRHIQNTVHRGGSRDLYKGFQAIICLISPKFYNKLAFQRFYEMKDGRRGDRKTDKQRGRLCWSGCGDFERGSRLLFVNIATKLSNKEGREGSDLPFWTRHWKLKLSLPCVI